jgi:5-methylcytosine-specific restriction protein A
VWIFPLRLRSGLPPAVPGQTIRDLERRQTRYAKTLTDDQLAEQAARIGGNNGSRISSARVYVRSAVVAEYALRRARGRCELCNREAPFRDKKGQPFLEVHHVVWLAKGGHDTIENTVALCPNCHRRMHMLDLASDREVLKAASAVSLTSPVVAST